MNDSIDPECCSMSYITVDQIARAALSLEPRPHTVKGLGSRLGQLSNWEGAL